MEVFGLLYIPWWISTIILTVISLYLYTFYKQSFFKRLGIPGPKPTPFFGVLPQLAKTGTFYLDVELVQKYGKCFGIYLGNIPSLMVSDPDMIREILVSKFSNFTNRSESVKPPAGWRLGLISSLDDHWKLMRGIISPTFSTGKLRGMSPIVHRCLDNFITSLNRSLESTPVIDVQKYFSALTMDVIAGTAFGIDVNALENPDNPFVNNAFKLMDIQIGKNPLIVLNFIFPEFQYIQGLLNLNFQNKDASDFINQTLQAAINERRNDDNPKFNDLLKLMMSSQSDSSSSNISTEGEETKSGSGKRGLTDEEIKANAGAFFLAGHDSTSATLSWVSYCLATNQDVQGRLIREIDDEVGIGKPDYDAVLKLEYLEMVMCETFRLHTPSARVVRDTAHDIEICGITIPKGTDVTIPIHGVHRLPEYWPEPERFDPERFSQENKKKIVPYTYLPFGQGPRNCVAMRLALMEVKMATVVLLQHFRLHPSEKLEIPPTVSKGVTLKPENGIWLRLEKRL